MTSSKVVGLSYAMGTTLLFLLCLLCTFHQARSAKHLLNVGQNITGYTSVLASPRHRFVLGFFSPPGIPKESYLGIWYNESEYPGTQTVVWVANRDQPVVGSNGVFQIADDDGNLVVTDTSGSGEKYWNTTLEGSSSRNRTVELMDSGNLVLIDGQNGTRYIWQSFQHPTDTFLPGMKMDTSLELTSWRGDNDPRSGNFTFKMAQTRNNHYVILHNQQLYWENDGVNSDELSPTILYYLANFTFSLSNFTINSTNSSTFSISSNSTFNSSMYLNYQDTRIVLNSTAGVIQFLKWENSQWTMMWKHPSDMCNTHNFCGNFSSCDSNYWMTCQCLPGFSLRSMENQHYEGGFGFRGCVRKSTSNDNSKDTDTVFLILNMIKVRNPDQGNSNIATESECQRLCLNMSHPQCQAYRFNATTYSDRSPSACWIWTRDLTTLQVVPDGGGALSVMVKRSDIAPLRISCMPCGVQKIPYPLSIEAHCGDPAYQKFKCSLENGQVSFTMQGGESFLVKYIDENTRKFYIQRNNSDQCNPKNQNDKPGYPFNVTNWCFKKDEIEISWQPAPEPPCDEPANCNVWPHSTCNATRERTKRCLCDPDYKWNATSLNCEEQSRSHSKRLRLILAVTLSCMIFLACTIIFALWRNKKAPNIDRANKQIQESLYDSERHVKDMIGLGGLEERGGEGIEVPFYTFGSILAATDNFSDSNKLGQGGYGPVYKGRFPGGQDIAVKRLSSASSQGLEEFKNEVVLIAKLQHRNLVRLRGYSIKGDEKLLLYEYMPNKSLDSFIFDRTRTLLLDWQMRFDIILGIARGLLYLHQDSRLRVIHRDLKTSNILLDEELIPKISDFGLAKIFGGRETEANTERVVGTYGYMAPEYALDGYFSIKSDVFSFGVVLLEILSGKRNTGFYQSKQTASLLGYAWGLWTEKRLLDLMDASLCETCNESQFIKCALIGLLCVQDEPADRPTMSNVVTMLDSEIATIPTPTQPTFYAMRRLPSTASSSSKAETTLQFDTSYQQGR